MMVVISRVVIRGPALLAAASDRAGDHCARSTPACRPGATVMDQEIRTRFNVLTWAVGVLAGLVIAMLGPLITMAHQLGQIGGELTVLINHVMLK